MQPAGRLEGPLRGLLRVALGFHVLNGASAALGLLVISAGIHGLLGAFAASIASVAVIVCIPPDQPAPRRGKFWQVLPAAVLGLPLFIAVQVLHDAPVRLGLLLVPASFVAFLAAAWGKRGLPLSMSIMFAMVFSMAVPVSANGESRLGTALYFALGAGLYLLWATISNATLNRRYRVQMLADTLLALAALMRTQARQFVPDAGGAPAAGTPLIGALLRQQAALADQLQTARDILLEAPRTPGRQRLAGLLLGVLELRDHLLACELDLDTLTAQPGHQPTLNSLREVLQVLAERVEQIADALLRGRVPSPFETLRPRLAALQGPGPADGANAQDAYSQMLARGLASRVVTIDEEVLRLLALSRGEARPDLELVRATWQMFVSPVAWSWQPFGGIWRWDAPPLRHALRAALAIGTAYAFALALPWGTHDYWILLTIVVVLRGSLAQTLERRNSRVAGTLLGCLLAAALLSWHTPALLLLVVMSLAQALAHAFAVRRYLVTAVAATVLGLLQSHLINVGASPAFEVVERMADTLIGVAIAWGFSYVLPSWERHQIPALVARTLAAQARHAQVALGLGQLSAVDNQPELAWRLARREAYDALSALVQATQRSLSEPRAVRPPLEPLGRLLAHSYQLLAQLTVVKTLLLLRRDRLKPEQIGAPLGQAAAAIQTLLLAPRAQVSRPSREVATPAGPVTLPDPFENDLSPWVLRRLELSRGLAAQLRDDADQVLDPAAFMPAAASAPAR